MKKKVISLLLCAAMVFTTGSMAFAADSVTAPIKLSLADAVKKMQTEGLKAQTAEINRQSDKATADGYSETARTIRDTLDRLSDAAGGAMMDGSTGEFSAQVTQKVTQMKRDFCKANIDNNYQADMNAIEKDTVEIYYGVLQAQDNVKAASDNLAIQNTTLANVQKKFAAGVSSKKDVLSAETAVTNAKSQLKTAQVKLSGAKMSLNMYLEYPLTQEVVLTDALKQLDGPTVTLDDAMKSAKANRMDIKLAQLGVDAQKIMLDNLKYTVSIASSTYKNQEIAYNTAVQGLKNAPVAVEMDIRNQFAGLEDKKLALESAKATAAFAKEGYRLAQISYDAGVNTLTDVQEMQLKAFQADQAVAAATTEYDLAVYEFKYAQGVGTERIKL